MRAAFYARMLVTTAAGALLIAGSWPSAYAVALPDVPAAPPTVPDAPVVSDVAPKPPAPAPPPAAADATPTSPPAPTSSEQTQTGGGSGGGGSGPRAARRTVRTARPSTRSVRRGRAKRVRSTARGRSTRASQPAVPSHHTSRGRPRAAATARAARRRKPAAAAKPVRDPVRTQARPPDIFTRIVKVIPSWIKALIGALAMLVVGLAVGAHRRVRRQAARHRHQALHDQLTELSNRRLFRMQVAEALAVAERDGGKVAVLLFDLDDFREVNDTLGHTNGDRLLQQVASRLTKVSRAGDPVARLGGDEFAVLVPGLPERRGRRLGRRGAASRPAGAVHTRGPSHPDRGEHRHRHRASGR